MLFLLHDATGHLISCSEFLLLRRVILFLHVVRSEKAILCHCLLLWWHLTLALLPCHQIVKEIITATGGVLLIINTTIISVLFEYLLNSLMLFDFP